MSNENIFEGLTAEQTEVVKVFLVQQLIPQTRQAIDEVLNNKLEKK